MEVVRSSDLAWSPHRACNKITFLRTIHPNGTEWRRGAQKRRGFQVLERVEKWQPLFGKNLRPSFETCPCIDRGGRRKRHGERIQFRGEISGRDEGERVNGGYRGSWNRGNQPDIDRIDRAYSPRLYVRLFAEK